MTDIRHLILPLPPVTPNTESDMELGTVTKMPTAEVVTITPEHAQELLRRNTRNRTVSARAVRNYADQMKAGRWKMNGESIKLGADGTIIDGQHRLHACVESGRAFTTLIIRHLDREVFDTIDTGKKRTAGDALSVDRIPDANAVAAATRWIIAMRRDAKNPRAYQDVTVQEIRDYLFAHPDIIQSTKKARAGRPLTTDAVYGALHYLFAQKDPEAADRFMEDLHTGSNLHAKDPVYILRERLIRDRMNMAKGRMPVLERTALTIRAWNHRRRGMPVTTLKGMVRKQDGTYELPRIE